MLVRRRVHRDGCGHPPRHESRIRACTLVEGLGSQLGIGAQLHDLIVDDCALHRANLAVHIHHARRGDNAGLLADRVQEVREVAGVPFRMLWADPVGLPEQVVVEPLLQRRRRCREARALAWVRPLRQPTDTRSSSQLNLDVPIHLCTASTAIDIHALLSCWQRRLPFHQLHRGQQLRQIAEQRHLRASNLVTGIWTPGVGRPCLTVQRRRSVPVGVIEVRPRDVVVLDGKEVSSVE